jgi:diguanylate cyclase
MTPEIQTPTEADKIDSVLEEYAAWFLGALRSVTYPEQFREENYQETPLFDKWASEQTISGIEDIKSLDQDIKKQAFNILKDSKELNRPPDYEDYNKFVTFYEEFTHLMRRLLREHHDDKIGFDPVTGFRNGELFFKDIVREIDRVSRQGKSFCVVLARIDNYDLIASDEVHCENILRVASVAIKKCLRSFDDAYRVEKGEFILSLKQAGIGGGMQALHRIKSEISHVPLDNKTDSGNQFLSMSFCIAEPLPEDDIRQLLSNMAKDMNSNADKTGAITEYFEMSPLQRLLREGRE